MESLFSLSFVQTGTPVSCSVATCGSSSSPLGWTRSSLPDAFGVFPWWVREERDTHCGGCSGCQVLHRPGVCRWGHEMGKRSKSSWKHRALKFSPWTSFQNQYLLPKPWRGTLRDREEMGKYLLKLKYLENWVKIYGTYGVGWRSTASFEGFNLLWDGPYQPPVYAVCLVNTAVPVSLQNFVSLLWLCRSRTYLPGRGGEWLIWLVSSSHQATGTWIQWPSCAASGNRSMHRMM